MFKKNSKKLFAILLTVIMIISAIPFTVFAAPASDIPADMLDNDFLDALAYTGYKLQAQKDDGTIFKKYGSSASAYLSGITYDSSFVVEGDETVSDTSTVSGKAPNIARFKQYGLCCAGYVSYVYFNYLPNIKGYDMSKFTKPANLKSATSYHEAAEKWVAAGVSKRLSFSVNSNVSFTPKEDIPIGSLVVFISNGVYSHVGLYAGAYGGKHFITHVGNGRGPEILTIEGLQKNGSAEVVSNIYSPPVTEADGAIEIYKKDTNGKNLSGAVFVATSKKDGIQYKIGPTNANGYAFKDRIPYGDYRVTETVFPTNFRAYEQTEWTVTVGKDNDGIVTINAVNEEIPGSAKIVKTSEDGKVDGISFRVQGNGVDQTVKTSNGGQIQIDNLKPGVYTVTEQTENKYVPQESRSVTVVSGQAATVTFNNTLKRGNLTVTKTAEDGLNEGVKFHLYGTSLSGLKVDEYAVVGSDGKARFQGVLIGSGYTLEEVETPDRYIVPDNQTADIEWNKITNKSFENILKRGDLTVTKTAEDILVEGIRFHLYGSSYSGIAVDEYATTNADGIAEFKNILIGTGYTLEEVNTPIRYVVPSNQTANIEWNTVTQKSFDNRLKKWNLTVTKKDSETSSAQGDASLAGAVYGIYKDDELIDRYTTDANGQFTTKYYVCGDDWSLREITPSEGYLIDTAVHHISAEAKAYTVEYNSISSTVNEQILKGKISVIKHSDDGSTQIETPEVGAEFQVFLKRSGSYGNAKESERDILVCDENGFAETKELPYGIYTVKQTKGWEGRELLKPFDVYIAQDGHIYRFLINNSNFESYVKIVKTDAETGKTIPYAGSGFQIYDPNGNLVTMTYTYPEVTTIDTFYTNSDGYLITPEKLPYGKGYSIVEVQAPYGYVLNSEPVYFDITEDNSTEESALTIVVATRPNMPQKGTITVGKTGEVISSVIESGDIYQPVYETKGLAGAVYEIRAAEDIYTLDGTLRYVKGDVVAKITTDKNGTATTDPLYLGKFEVREKAAPYGMVISDEAHFVELTYAGQEIKITNTATDFYNERQKAEIRLSKILEKDEIFGIGNNGEILSVQFGLYVAEDIIAADGTRIPKDGLIEIVNCDENSNAIFKSDIPVGSKLYVKEIATDSHYILSDTKYPVVFEYAGQNVALVSITVNNGEEISNDIIYGTIKGLKVDRETEETIAGAVFGLFKADETEFTEETAILTAISVEDGVFLFGNVLFGDWIVKELQPAENYLPTDDIHYITVSKNEQLIEITAVNDRIPELGTTATVDGEKEICATEMFTLTDTVSYKHLIPGKEYVLKGVLMDKTTGKPLVIDSQEIHAETVFIPEAPTGEAVVEFTFDSKYIKEDTDIVVFESLYHDDKELTVHANIEDEGQTVKVKVPEIGTQATVNGKKEITAEEKVAIDDIVFYKNLTPGKEYTVKGVLMNKATGIPFTVNGEEIYSEVTFIPETPDGEVTVTFVFDASELKNATEIVVFETLYRDGVEIAIHTDIEDDGQTVKITPPVPPILDIPNTGDNSNMGFFIGLGAIALGGLISTLIIRIKQKKDDDDQ